MSANISKHTKCAVIASMLCCTSLIYANPYQPGSQQWHNYNGMAQHEVNKQQQQNSQSRSNAAARRAWEARERKVQARIAKHRATPWYMAIAYDFTNKKVAWAGGYASEQRAVEIATEDCRRIRKANCQLALVFHNACAVMTSPYAGVKSMNDIFFGIHPDDKQAAEISIKKCEAVHGKDNCGYSAMKTKHGTSFCVGYDYSIYGH